MLESLCYLQNRIDTFEMQKPKQLLVMSVELSILNPYMTISVQPRLNKGCVIQKLDPVSFCCIFTSVVSKLFWLWWKLCIWRIEHLLNWTNKSFCTKKGSFLTTQISCSGAGCPVNFGSLLTILVGRGHWFSSSQHWVQLFLWDFPCTSSEFTWVISVPFYHRHFLCDF